MIGTSIGPYEIRSALGAGGMGEVYRARDSRLGRDVALKILPQAVAADPDRVARFRREAQLLASLNHQHIAAIHGLEELSGVPVLVLELVEGPTLADRLLHGPMPLGEAFAAARQIAEALDAAHAQGIVHRDLKPANIKLRGDGTVKVLDFGLAKALDGPADGRGVQLQPDDRGAGQTDLTGSPTITSPAMTRIGVILGTASYMSPEQARGLVVDRGADIWAWGCVLFEMLTGRRAFDGADPTDAIAAVVRGEPEWSRLPPDTPASVRRLLRRCLEKDPRRRLADIRDARFTLEDLASEPGAAVPAPGSRFRERVLWAGALLLSIAGSTALFWRPGTPAPREMRVEITTPPTTDPVSFALSPDGDRVAFVASTEGRPMLWVRSLTTGEAAPLPNTDGASFPFWSPDSRSIGFFANDRVNRIDVDGGAFRGLASAPVGTGGTWSREGVILFTLTPDAQIFRVSDTGGTADLVPGSAQGLAGHRFPQFLPDGRRYLYFVAETSVRGVYVGNLDSPDRRRLFDADAAAVFVPPAEILFVRAGRLLLQRFDVSALTLQGEARVLAEGVVVDSSGAIAASASATGAIVYRVGSTNRQRQLAWFDRSGAQIGDAFPPDSDNLLNPAISPDGRYAAAMRSIGGVVDIWLQDLTRKGALTKLTSSPPPDITPVWSPDGQRVAHGTGGRQGFGIAVTSLSSNQTSVILDGDASEIPVDWSRDGRFILYRAQTQNSGIDSWALPVSDPKAAFPIAQTPADERGATVSPDGKWVAFESNESGHYEVYVQAFPKPGEKTVVSTGGGRQVRWGPNAGELFYVALDATLMSVSLRPRPDGLSMEAATPVPLFRGRILGVPTGGSVIEYDVTRDGKRFLMNTLVEHAGAPLTLVLNASGASQ